MTRYYLPSPSKQHQIDFRLNPVVSVNPVLNGDAQTIVRGEARWTAEIETTTLSRRQAGNWTATLNDLQGGVHTLMMHDASKLRPQAYAAVADGAAWSWSSTDIYLSDVTKSLSTTTAAKPWGNPSVIAYDYANGLIQLAGLTPGATLYRGDLGSWFDGPAVRYVEIARDVTADASGQVWVKVNPPPPSAQTYLPAPFEMERPTVEMIVLEHSEPYQLGDQWRVSVRAAQVIRRA